MKQAGLPADPRGTMVLYWAGIFFILLELYKQITLLVLFHGEYNIWYLPFQLCSMPIYLCPAMYICTRTGRSGQAGTIATFLADFGMLGGICALLVRDGFQFPGHPLLTAHGWIWHLAMIALALYLWLSGRTEHVSYPDALKGSVRGFRNAVLLFLGLAAAAFLLDVLLHPLGDCDMFYISPWHLSSQPVFRSIDAVIGRPAGILVYLGSVILGAAIIHAAMTAGSRIRDAR